MPKICGPLDNTKSNLASDLASDLVSDPVNMIKSWGQKRVIKKKSRIHPPRCLKGAQEPGQPLWRHDPAHLGLLKYIVATFKVSGEDVCRKITFDTDIFSI